VVSFEIAVAGPPRLHSAALVNDVLLLGNQNTDRSTHDRYIAMNIALSVLALPDSHV